MKFLRRFNNNYSFRMHGIIAFENCIKGNLTIGAIIKQNFLRRIIIQGLKIAKPFRVKCLTCSNIKKRSAHSNFILIYFSQDQIHFILKHSKHDIEFFCKIIINKRYLLVYLKIKYLKHYRVIKKNMICKTKLFILLKKIIFSNIRECFSLDIDILKFLNV